MIKLVQYYHRGPVIIVWGGGGGDVRLGGFWMNHNKNLPDPFIGLCDVLTVAFSLIGS